MVADDVKLQLELDISSGLSVKNIVSSVKEVSKSTKPYKRFGGIKTEAYVFWDGSALLFGALDTNVAYAAKNSYNELDSVYLNGSWD